jgi:myo-inositol 2-dehydrogenase/D-chiro-inositol 1-dehydrogenase
MVSDLTVGIVGAGYIAHVHAQAYAETPGVRVVGVADPAPGKADRLAGPLGARGLTTLEELLALAPT